jgi:hypothetical protein
MCARLSRLCDGYSWEAGPDPSDKLGYGDHDVFGHLNISGDRRKCHLSSLVGVNGGVLKLLVEVSPTYDDVCDPTDWAGKYLYRATDGIVSVGWGGSPKSTWFHANCRSGTTGFSERKLAVLHGFVSHFVPTLATFYSNDESNGGRRGGVAVVARQALEKLPMPEWLTIASE